MVEFKSLLISLQSFSMQEKNIFRRVFNFLCFLIFDYFISYPNHYISLYLHLLTITLILFYVSYRCSSNDHLLVITPSLHSNNVQIELLHSFGFHHITFLGKSYLSTRCLVAPLTLELLDSLIM